MDEVWLLKGVCFFNEAGASSSSNATGKEGGAWSRRRQGSRARPAEPGPEGSGERGPEPRTQLTLQGRKARRGRQEACRLGSVAGQQSQCSL